MHLKIRNSEQGQAIIYLVIGIVVFLGFVALAIDGGMALADRRHSQNLADASSLAGGGEAGAYLEHNNVQYYNWSCSDSRVISAMNLAERTAKERAQNNNFSIDYDLSDHNGVDAQCGSISYPGYKDIYIDVTVEISATTQSNFLQLIFPDALHNEVDAVTRVRPSQPRVFGSTVVSLNTDACADPGTEGGIFYGNSTITLNNGGVFANGCLRGNGQPIVDINCGSNPNCGAYGDTLVPGNAQWNPTPTTTNIQMPISNYIIQEPVCDNRPGVHKVNKLPDVLEDGLYCITGNLIINAHDTIDGTHARVTIYVPNGDFTINGTPQVEMYAPDTDHPDPTGTAIPGVLIYVPASDPYNTSSCPEHTVKLNGTETSVFYGMILAPCSNIKLIGTGGNTYDGQVIGWNVEVGGDSETIVTYTPDPGAFLPTWIDLYK